MMTFIRRSIAPLMVCVGIAGCGLSDYESRMDAERLRIKLYDEENRLLGELAEPPPAQPPAKEGEPERPVWPFDVCLRLPQGVSGQIAGVSHGTQSPPVLLFRYAGQGGFNVFVAAAWSAPKNKENIYRPGEWPVDDFRREVRAAVGDYYKKFGFARIFKQANPTRDRRVPENWRGEEPTPLDFDRFTGDDNENKQVKDHSKFELYFYNQGNKQVAIAFQIPEAQANDKQVTDAIDLCLKSLDISDNAAARKSELSGIISRRKKA